MSEIMDKIKNSAKLRQLAEKDKAKCDNLSCEKQNIDVEYELTDNDPSKEVVMKVNGKVVQKWENVDAFNEDRRSLIKEFRDKTKNKKTLEKKSCKIKPDEVVHFPTFEECLDFLNDSPFTKSYMDDFMNFIDYGFTPWRALDAIDLFPVKWLKQETQKKQESEPKPTVPTRRLFDDYSRIFQPRFPQWPVNMMERFNKMEEQLNALMEKYENDPDAKVVKKSVYYKSYKSCGHEVVVQGDDENGYTIKDGDTVLKKFTPEEFKDKKDKIDWYIEGYLLSLKEND